MTSIGYFGVQQLSSIVGKSLECYSRDSRFESRATV